MDFFCAMGALDGGIVRVQNRWCWWMIGQDAAALEALATVRLAPLAVHGMFIWSYYCVNTGLVVTTAVGVVLDWRHVLDT